jgi:hypothetical protein
MTTDTTSAPTTPLSGSTGLVRPMASLWCADCGAPATHEVLPRTRRGMRFTCEMGARALDPEHRRRLTLADFAA